MTGVLVLFGTIMAVGVVIALLDWLARRKEDTSKHRPAA